MFHHGFPCVFPGFSMVFLAYVHPWAIPVKPEILGQRPGAPWQLARRPSLHKHRRIPMHQRWCNWQWPGHWIVTCCVTSKPWVPPKKMTWYYIYNIYKYWNWYLSMILVGFDFAIFFWRVRSYTKLFKEFAGTVRVCLKMGVDPNIGMLVGKIMVMNGTLGIV